MDHFIGRSKLQAACFCCIVILLIYSQSKICRGLNISDAQVTNTHHAISTWFLRPVFAALTSQVECLFPLYPEPVADVRAP